MFKKIKLKNNVRLIVAPLAEAKTITLLVLFKVGSRYEAKRVAGISHFVEHMMFKGTVKRPNTLAISKELDGIGAEFNAFTGKDYTGYYIKANAKHLDLAIEVLSDMLLNSKFDAKEVNREKGVIVEEINMYEDNPIMYIDDLLEQLMFDAPLGTSIAGSRASVKGISQKDLLDFRDKFYRSSNVVIGLVGDVNAGKISDVANKFNFKTTTAKNHFIPVTISQASPKVVVKFKETEQTQIALGLPAYSYADPKIYVLQLLSVILGGNMSSRLFLKVRERNGLAYFIRSSLSVYEDTGALVIQAGLDKSRIDRAIMIIMAELKRMKTGGVTLTELRRAKEYMSGKISLDLEDTSHLCQWFAQQELLTEHILTPQEKINKLMSVTIGDVAKVAKEVFNFHKINLAIIGPFDSEAQFKKLLK